MLTEIFVLEVKTTGYINKLNILSIKTKKATILLRVISSVIVIIADNSWSNRGPSHRCGLCRRYYSMDGRDDCNDEEGGAPTVG